MSRYTRWVPILFAVSLLFLMTHVLDDAFNLNEPRDWGVSVPEFLLIVASMYLIIPPLGAAMARRGRPLGFVIVMLYAFQAFYGAGFNHIRHLTGDFGGVGIFGKALMAVGVDCLNMKGQGYVTGILAMLGCGTTNPHSHAWWSTAVALINVLLNIPLIGLCVFAIIQWWREHREIAKSADPVSTSSPASSKV